MDHSALNAAIRNTGREFFEAIKGEAPSVFNKGFWTGKVMDWAMQNEEFKVQLFRFVDVLPYLNTGQSLTRHIEEYFGEGGEEIPAVLKWGAGKSGLLGGIATKVMSKAIRANIESMAKQFIIGQQAREAVKNLRKLRGDGFAFTLDLLGEATVSEEESEAYMNGYLEVLGALADEQQRWSALGGGKELDWNHAPKVNVSVKPSALYSQSKPVDQEGTVRGILARMRPIYRKVVEMGGFLCIDMEALKYKEATLEVFRRLRTEPEFADYPHLSIVLQAYLKDTERDLDELIAWARENEKPIGIRLVKGAYWDYETVIALQNGWEVPVWTNKAQSDMAHEKLSRKILENTDIIYFQCASHNVRSIANVMETAKALGVAESRYEFQVLYGMAEPVRKGLKNVAGRVRLYCPYGELIPGMAYLVRRLLENTANESFLRQSFADGEEIDRLMEDPEETYRRTAAPKAEAGGGDGLDAPFANDPSIDFTIPGNREAFAKALAQVRSRLGRSYPLFIGGAEVETEKTINSLNPANPTEVIGTFAQAGQLEIDHAIRAARKAFPAWRETPALERARILHRAADIMRKRQFELSAWQILEVGKQWDQAYHDVGEAIDFLEYYAREMIRLSRPRRMGRAPGENNQLFYEPKGIAAVISPWNFPLAISTGMVAANIVCGNPVIFKPSNLAPMVGWGLVEIFRKAGLPEGVFNYCPGSSRDMGDYLVEHPEVAVISFTGSEEVGLRIQEKAAKPSPGQTHCKRVVAEMGGKNAIVIDDDADLDEAVLHVIYSAFAFQGQKCSACSRVIVVEPIYERFIERLTRACEALKIGPSEDPANYMGPVVDASAQRKILEMIAVAESEGTVLVKRAVPEQGFYVPLTIVTDITPEHRIAQEEVFGPVLAVMRAKDFDQAIEWANSTRFALTG
ncbi:MAG: proline dehydrogenase family protein, partial [Desulfovibrionaceae bacterium]